MKYLKECPILVGIVTIAAVLSVVSFILKDTTYASYQVDSEQGNVPVLSLLFKGARDGVFPWSAPDSEELYAGAVNGNPVDASADDTASEPAPTGEETSGDPANAADTTTAENESTDVSGNDSDGDVSGNDAGDVSGNSEDITYEFTEVGPEYFDDALFIGDSRTVGLSEYCEPLDERATFYSKISLTIFDVMKKEFVKTDKGKISVDQALQENQFGKIYIMLGLNEIGTGDAEYFKNAYAEVINRIVELQPNAIIYIQGIMHVTEAKSDSNKYFSNDNINERNAAIAELADQKRIFYIDMNPAVDDGKGNLDSALSFDDVHLKAPSYLLWYDFLLHNAIVR